MPNGEASCPFSRRFTAPTRASWTWKERVAFELAMVEPRRLRPVAVAMGGKLRLLVGNHARMAGRCAAVSQHPSRLGGRIFPPAALAGARSPDSRRGFSWPTAVLRAVRGSESARHTRTPYGLGPAAARGESDSYGCSAYIGPLARGPLSTAVLVLLIVLINLSDSMPGSAPLFSWFADDLNH